MTIRAFLSLAFAIMAGKITLAAYSGNQTATIDCTVFTFVSMISGIETKMMKQDLNVAIPHIASALMAMEHFNERIDTVVPELNEIPDCSFRFNVDASIFFDTGPMGSHYAVRALLAQSTNSCAIVGAYYDLEAVELGTIATAYRIPFTIHRAFTVRASSPLISPYSTQVFPDMLSYVEFTARFMVQKGRDNFIAFLYALTETGTQWREAVSLVFDKWSIQHRAFPYMARDGAIATRNVELALRQVKESGYRTILVSLYMPQNEIPEIAKIAYEMNLTNGKYLWVFIGNLDMNFLLTNDFYVRKLLKGSVYLSPLDFTRADHDRFLMAWRSQNQTVVNRIQEKLDEIVSASTSTYVVPDDLFSKYYPTYGSGFMYDAVMATGIGACQALNPLRSSNNDAIRRETEVPWGLSFVKGIRAVDFWGASGRVKFGCEEAEDDEDECYSVNGREADTITWSVWNLLPTISGEEVTSQVTDLYNESIGFLTINDAVYADNTTSPPLPLRDATNQNYLNKGMKIFGLTSMALSWLASLTAFVWTFINREHRILKASQPEFLYIICLGSALMASAIFPTSFDESDGWSQTRLDRSCTATKWLFCLGFITVYSALYAKLWRINEVLQASRRVVLIRRALWPCVVLVLFGIVILTLWTILSPLRWTRVEVNDVTGESIASCSSSGGSLKFLIPIAIIMLVPAAQTAWMAHKTKDIHEDFSESKWIFVMILVQCELVLFALPVVIILRDVTTNVRYLGYTLLCFIFSISSLVFMFLPKKIAFDRHNSRSSQKKQRGGAQGDVHVTGLTRIEHSHASQAQEATLME